MVFVVWLITALLSQNYIVFQVELWKKYITWEKNNPLRTEDQALIAKRGKTMIEYSLLGINTHSKELARDYDMKAHMYRNGFEQT